MPILYVSMINERRCVLTEAYGTQQRGDFKAQALKHYSKFTQWGLKTIKLSQAYNLAYRDRKDFAIVTISNVEDVKDIECQRFMEKAEEIITNILNNRDIEQKLGIQLS